MTMTKLTLLTVLSVTILVSTAACATGPQPDKDYTIKTVKMTHAPRDKFWKIVKVPKTPATAPCPADPSKPQTPCGAHAKTKN